MGALPHRSIHALSKRYGPLMQLRFGSVPVVVGSSPEMARLFLKTHDAMFADRPRTAAGRYTTYNSSDILWSPYGAHWRQLRKIGTAELLGPARVDSYGHVRREEVRALLRGLHRSAVAGRAVPLRERLFTSNFGVITRMMLSDKYVEVEGERSLPSPSPALSMTPEELTRLMDEFFYLNGVLNVGDFIPWLQWLDLQGYVGRMKKLGNALDGFVSHVVGEHIERRRAEGESFVARDVVDALLVLADDPSLDVKLERDVVKSLTQDLLAGATNNSGITVEWAMSELLRKPEIMGRAAEELDRVVGRGRLVEESDLPMLPYVEAIVKETLRVHPAVPLLLPHEAREDAIVAGYDVRAGTRVVVSAWAMARDPSLWDVPEEFLPERFMDTAAGSKVDVYGQDMNLLPFGSGRRMCPGANLGLRMTLITLGNLLHGFAWRLPADGVPPEQLSMDEIFGLATTRKFPLHVVAEPRLPAHLYA